MGKLESRPAMPCSTSKLERRCILVVFVFAKDEGGGGEVDMEAAGDV
jgi:hypothetical protein